MPTNNAELKTQNSKLMKIAFIAPFGVQPKGTVRARMVPMAQALARRGHVVRIVVPAWDDPHAPDRVQVSDLTPPGAEGRAQLVTLPRPRHRGGLGLVGGLVRWSVGRWKPDVVHVFKPIGYSGLAAFALAALRVPWLLDVDDWEGPGGWADVNPYTPAQKLSITLTEATLPRLAGAVTAASRALEARTWDMGLPRRRVFYVPNGVSRDKYREWGSVGAKYALPLGAQPGLGDAPVILLYSRLAEFPYWWPLDVLRHVSDEHLDARLLVVGGGFFGEEGRLGEEAARMGLGDRVLVTGQVAEEDVPAYLSLADVALYPMADNLINRAKSPVKALEPMLMGLPVVAHRIGQAAEFIGDAGVLVEPGDLRGMGDAVSALLGDEGRRLELGAKARERVWREFNWDGLCLGVEWAYRVMLEHN